MQPIFHVVETFPKLSESFIYGKVAWLLEQGIPTRVIDKYPQRREYDYFPPHLQQAFKACTLGLYPGHNTLQRTINRSLKVLRAWSYGLPRYPLLLRRYQHTVAANRRNRDFQWPMPSNRRSKVSAKVHTQQSIDRFLNLYYTLKLKPSCIHVHFGFNALDWVPIKQVLGDRVQLMVSFLGSDLTVYPKDNPAMYKPLFDVGDMYLASSPYLRDLAVEYGCPEDKIHVHPVEIDTEFFQPPPEPLSSTPVFRIISVGRLVWEKDYRTALNAVAILKSLVPDAAIEYHIVGDGPLEGELRALAQHLHLEGCVTFWGAKDRKWVRKQLWQSDVFFLTSISEGLGASILEAAACGLPVVATQVGGIPMTVVDEESGFLLPASMEDALAHKLKRLMHDATLREKMGAAGRQHVLSQFSAPILYPRLLEYYGLSQPASALATTP